ncbi:uncharacterized protein LOC142558104 [Dermacentor variabilis]|uniref:uncharacterized protein LOC142558104 n=1 Tax=Dermacentor variabilis TaxID=34621 RepID=UPI003F5AE087
MLRLIFATLVALCLGSYGDAKLDWLYQWVPSHVGLPSNEAADAVAKEGHSDRFPIPNSVTPFDVAKTTILRTVREAAPGPARCGRYDFELHAKLGEDPECNGYMEINDTAHGRIENKTLRYWNKSEHCGVFTLMLRGEAQCELHVWNTAVASQYETHLYLRSCVKKYQDYCPNATQRWLKQSYHRRAKRCRGISVS